jgi:anti-sigma B factor antagonist
MPRTHDGRSESRLVISEQAVGAAAVVSVAGEIDSTTADQFEQQIRAVLARRPAAVIVDLSAAEFLASAGISALVRTYDACGSAAYALVADRPGARRPLDILGIGRIINIYSTLAEAIDSLAE